MNRISIIGNLTRDPELRTVNVAGQQVNVCSFDVAVNERRGDRETTSYYRVSAWRGLADVCKSYLQKGRKVYVDGAPRVNAYIGNDGQPRGNIEINAQNVEFLSSRQDTQQTAQPLSRPQQATQGNYDAPTAQAPTGFAVVDDDALPF